VEDIVGQEDLAQDIQRQQKLMELVKDNLAKGQEKTMGKVKVTTKTSDFKVRDKVWRQNIRSQQRKGGETGSQFFRSILH